MAEVQAQGGLGLGRHAWLWFVILGLTAWLYLPALQFDLFGDDFGFYGHKPLLKAFVGYFIRGERPSLAPEQSTFFRPLSDFVWAAYFRLFGHRVQFYHLCAILVHLANIVLVFLFARRLVRLQRGWALCAALVFALFWFNFEAVAWLSANDTAICTAFALSSILCLAEYLRRGGGGWFAGFALLAILAVATKEFGLILPLLLVVVWFLPFDRPVRQARRRMTAALLVSGAIVACYLVARWALGIQTVLPTRLLGSALQSGWGFAGLVSGSSRSSVASAIGVLLFVTSVLWRRTRPLALWVLVALTPALSQGVQMRYGYMASVGLAVLVVLILEALQRRPPARLACAATVVLMALSCALLYSFWAQSGPSLRFVLPGLALTILVLVLLRRRGRLSANLTLALATVAVLVAGNFGFALDYPWECRKGGKARRLARELLCVLPDGQMPLVIVLACPSLQVDDEIVPHSYVRPFLILLSRRRIEILRYGEFWDGITDGSLPAPDRLVVIEQTDGRIRRREDLERLVQAKLSSLRTVVPQRFCFKLGDRPTVPAGGFTRCGPRSEAACLIASPEPLDTVIYDLVSLSWAPMDRVLAKHAWLEWYAEGQTLPAGRRTVLIESSGAVFRLRSSPNWLAARHVGMLRLGISSAEALPASTLLCVQRQALEHKQTPQARRPLLKKAIDLKSLKRSGAISPGE